MNLLIHPNYLINSYAKLHQIFVKTIVYQHSFSNLDDLKYLFKSLRLLENMPVAQALQ